MLKIVLVAHLTYKNQCLDSNTKIQTFGIFGTPNCAFVCVCLCARGGEGAEGGGNGQGGSIHNSFERCWLLVRKL